MTPTDAARLIADMKPSGAKQFLIREHGPDIARALLDAEEREREYKHTIDEIFGTDDLSLIYSVIYNLRFKLGQDPATGKAGG